MVNGVGKYFYFILFFFFFSNIQADIRFKLTDMSGVPLKKAAIGVPFILEVAATSSTQSIQSPSVKGIEALQPKQIGFQLRGTGSGQTEVIYKYRLQATEAGIYTVGPVLAKNGMPIDATTFSFAVANETITQQTQKKQIKSEPFFRLTCNKTNPIVGEKIMVTGRFYYVDDTLSLNSVSEPNTQNLVRFSTQGPTQGKEEIHGTIYQFIEWQWECGCQEFGRTVVPACVADFEIYKHQQYSLGGLGRFFGPQIDQQRIYSNAIVLTVDPLPPCEKDVAFIGTLETISASISPTAAKEGEGMVFTLALQGEGVTSMKTPVLRNIPGSFKYYESKTVTKPTQYTHINERQFEYIVQGFEHGSWTIPAQEFTYFDTQCRSYKTVQTDPVSVIIAINAALTFFNEPNKPEKEHNYDKKEQLQLIPLLSTYTQPINEKQLPWWLFVIFAVIPLLFNCFFWIKKRWFGGGYSQDYLSRNAFGLARKQFKKEYVLSAHHIHHTLKQCFAYRFNIAEQEVTPEFMQTKLLEAGLSEKKCSEWNAFTGLLAEQEFGIKNNQSTLSTSILLKKATQWLDQLEGKL